MRNTASKFPFSIGCVIMASGLGQRFGGNKLLADFCGKPMISYLIENILSIPGLSPLAVTRNEETAALCRERGIPVLCHNLPHRNDTVRLGLGALLKEAPAQKEFPSRLSPSSSLPLSSAQLSGCLFCPADQPLLRRESLCTLIETFSQNPDKICRLSYGERAGSPVLFGRQFFLELLALPQGVGGSYLIKKYPAQVILVPARDPYELYDVDTPEDLEFLSRL